MPKNRTPENRVLINPTAQQQIKRAEALLSEAQSLPTIREDMERFYKDHPNHPYASIFSSVSRSGFGLDPSQHLKVASPVLTMRIRQALNEIAPDSEYSRNISQKDSVEEHMTRLRAIVTELKSGTLGTAYALAHAEAFATQLDQANYLSDEGYQIAAVVTAGSVGEAHVKLLAARYKVACVDANGRPIKADQINAELVKQGAYDKTKQKQLTAWFGLRNDAAHGVQVTISQADAYALITGWRDFLKQFPA